MRCGLTLFIQNYEDWDRFEAAERGETVPRLDPDQDRRRWLEEIDTALKIEDQGFDSLWTVEHHVSPYTMIPNPIQVLTYFAGATSRIDVGTMVVVLPWHNPLLIAEDMTILQYLLRGRTPYIGVGRGVGRREFNQLGVDMNETRGRFAEAIQIIQRAITEETFSFEGEYYDLQDITMRPRPLDPDALIDAMHFAWGSPTSAEIGGGFGLKPLIIPQRTWDSYHAELADFNDARIRAGFDATRPRLHMSLICAETEDEAYQLAKTYIAQYTDSAERNYEIFSNHFGSIKGYEHYANITGGAKSKEQLLADTTEMYLRNHVWGTPDQCIAKLRQISDDFHPEEFMFVMRMGTMSKEVADRNIDLFAREVLPALHEMPTLPPIDYATPRS